MKCKPHVHAGKTPTVRKTLQVYKIYLLFFYLNTKETFRKYKISFEISGKFPENKKKTSI